MNISDVCERTSHLHKRHTVLPARISVATSEHVLNNVHKLELLDEDCDFFQRILPLFILIIVFYYICGFEISDNIYRHEIRVDNDEETKIKNGVLNVTVQQKSDFRKIRIRRSCSANAVLISNRCPSEPLQKVTEKTETLNPTVLDAGVITTEKDNSTVYAQIVQEAPEEYCYGGYHNVQIGDVYNDRYVVIRKLGWGHFSTVWLCGDTKENILVAVKIVKSGDVFTDTALDEITLCTAVNAVGKYSTRSHRIVKLLDRFKITDVNGTHMCLVFELLGPNLLHLIMENNEKGIPLRTVKIIIRQVLEGLAFLHDECKIIHTDIKPENILLTIDKEYRKKLLLDTAKWLGSDSLPKSFVSNMPDNLVPEKKSLTMLKLKVNEFLLNIYKYEDKRIRWDSSSPKLNVNISRTNLSSSPDSKYNTTETSKISNTSTYISQYFPKKGDSLSTDADTISIRRQDSRDSDTSDEIQVKLADMGNACWEDRQYTTSIQTCQYRCLETLIGSPYDTSADIWSVACVAFELATTDYLFEPKETQNYSTEEDHLAHIIELLGSIPKELLQKGNKWNTYFRLNGELKNIKKLQPWPLKDVLMEKYDFGEQDAIEFSEFLLPMLNYDPKKRPSAAECLNHPFLAKNTSF